MNKIVALAFSDAHFNDWKESYEYKGDRLGNSLKVLKLIGTQAKILKVPILFCGDLIHKPKAIDNKVFDRFINCYKKYIEDNNLEFIAISGNHDQCDKNTPEYNSPSYIRTFAKLFKKFSCIDYTTWQTPSLVVMGIPYLTGNIGFKDHVKEFSRLAKKEVLRKTILLIHTDLPGAKNGFGFEIGECKNIPEHLDEYFKEFDLVLAGHIHKPQQLAKNTFMLGSPSHQNAGDCGVEMGYWEIYEDGPPKLIPLDLPQYKWITFGEPLPDDFHIYMHTGKPQTENTEAILNKGFSNKSSKTKIAKTYLKKKGIKSKSKKKALISILKNDYL